MKEPLAVQASDFRTVAMFSVESVVLYSLLLWLLMLLSAF